MTIKIQTESFTYQFNCYGAVSVEKLKRLIREPILKVSIKEGV